MGAFAEMLDKASRIDREARLAERTSMIVSYNITPHDVENGSWEIREEGGFGHTTISLYKRVECKQINIESMVRKTVVDIV